MTDEQPDPELEPQEAAEAAEPAAEPEAASEPAEIPESATRATEVALARLPDLREIEPVFELPAGAIHPNGLQLSIPGMSFDDWTSIGHRIGAFSRWSRFALGDWLLFGEEIFGEDSAQAVEGTPAERYDVARRVTGLEVGTLQNYASLCARIPLPIRRTELNFSAHEPVAALERDEQIHWLDQAVANGWDRSSLRDAIRDAKRPPSEDPPPAEVLDPQRSRAERLEDAVHLAIKQAQPTTEGGATIPPAPWKQILEAAGEE